MVMLNFKELQKLKQDRLAKERGDLIEEYLSTYPRVDNGVVHLSIKKYRAEDYLDSPTVSQFSSFLIEVEKKYPGAEIANVAYPWITDESDDDVEGRFRVFEIWIKVPAKPEDIEYDKEYAASLISLEQERKKNLYLSLKKEFEKYLCQK